MTSRVEDKSHTAMSQVQVFRASLGVFARRNGLTLGIIGVFLLIWLLFILARPSVFLKPDIYAAFMMSVPFFGVMALPLTLVVISGEMDLSVGSTMAVGVMAFTLLFRETNSVILSLVACLLAGFLVGILNGLIVVRIGIPSLIATLGAQFLWRGVVLVIGDATMHGGGASLVAARGDPVREALVGRLGGYLPMQVVWMVLVGIAMWILLNRHKFGAHVFLVGDNRHSAQLMGVNVDRTRVLVFALVGVAAAFGGLLSSLEVSYFWPSLGEGYWMQTLAAVFLGGTSVFGGTGTVVGTFVGCFIIGGLDAGIIAIGAQGMWTQLIFGLIIVLSVAMHAYLRRRME